MKDRVSISRRLAEQVLRRAASLENQERTRSEEGFTPEEIRAAALEVGLDSSLLGRAADDLLERHDRRSRRVQLGYAGGTGALAAVATAGLLATGQLHLAIPFVVVDLILARRVASLLHRRSLADGLPLRALAGAERPGAEDR